jgi:DNA-directed RNA polymerase subunit RPC12/RpoP
MIPRCNKCGEQYPSRRKELGYLTCVYCGEKDAKQVKHCIVPLHKSNYMVVTDKSLLTGINNKGGLTK